MQESVDVRVPRDGGPIALALSARYVPGLLTHRSVVGAGVWVGVDLLAPDRWCSVEVGATERSATVLAALVGDAAVRRLAEAEPTPEVTVDMGAAGPWLRVAAVDAVDRWLHLPLDQPVVDAERAVSRALAAARLPLGPARDLVLDDALRIGRRAAPDLTDSLRRLKGRGGPFPERLRRALDCLVEGYRMLLAEVDGPDRDLSAVVRTWHRMQEGFRAGRPGERRATRRPGRHHGRDGWTGLIDPRQVPARVLAMSADAGKGEVDLTLATSEGREALQVRVPTFRGDVDDAVAHRLLVRLVDVRTSRTRSEALLHLPPRRRGRATDRVFLQCTVPLQGSDVADLRVDVFDATSDVPPAASDAELGEVRRAALFLREWRRLVAGDRLSLGAGGLDAQLAGLAERITPPGGDGPAFPDGPSADAVLRLAETAGTSVGDRLRGAGQLPGGAALRSVCGSGGLLVAELVAAWERPTD